MFGQADAEASNVEGGTTTVTLAPAWRGPLVAQGD
jgi:hypothetical protein